MSFFNCNLAGSAGGSGGTDVEDLAPVLLWENPDPTAVFENQKIELNLTDYAGVIIEYYLDTNNQIIANRLYVKKDDTFTTNDNRNNFGAGYEGSSIVTRALNSVTDNYVWFRNGLLGDGTQTINNGVIPYRIYGVKEYIVEVDTSTPVDTGSYQVVEGYASLTWTNTKQTCLNIITNEVIDEGMSTRTLVGTGDDIIIATFAKRAAGNTDIGAPFGSITNVKLMPIINNSFANNYIPCKGTGANEEAGGYSSFAILIADDATKPFSVSGLSDGWASGALVKLSRG